MSEIVQGKPPTGFWKHFKHFFSYLNFTRYHMEDVTVLLVTGSWAKICSKYFAQDT